LTADEIAVEADVGRRPRSSFSAAPILPIMTDLSILREIGN
jgi:hypothetical protein